GRLASYKGIDVLLDAVGPQLEAENQVLVYLGAPDLNVAGTGVTLRGMQERIEREGWGGRVRFVGFREDGPRLMASADVLAHPTMMEGFGLTLVEALATGLPVVATNIEAIPEILEDTASLLVPAGDSEALRTAIRTVLDREPLAAAYTASKGRERAGNFRM